MTRKNQLTSYRRFFYYAVLCALATAIVYIPLPGTAQILLSPVPGLHSVHVDLRATPAKAFRYSLAGAKSFETRAANLVRQNSALLGISRNPGRFSFAYATYNSSGAGHARMNQTIDGIPVYGAQLVVHEGRDSLFASVTGRAFQGIGPSTTPVLDSEEAAQSTLHFAASAYPGSEPIVLRTQLYILDLSLFDIPQSSEPHLSWRVDLYQQAPSFHEIFFVDAQDGSLLYRLTGIRPAIYRKIHDCSQYATECALDQLVSGHIYGRSEGHPSRGSHPLYNDYDVDDAYDVVGSVHSYFYSKYGRNGANGFGGIGNGTTYSAASTVVRTYINHYPFPQFGVQDCPNAFFDGVGSINLCRGVATPDIVGHEYGHAIDYFSIRGSDSVPQGLDYVRESGAISESLGDIFGAAAENYISPSSANWNVGEGSAFGIIRSMLSPTSASSAQPDRVFSPLYYCGQEDFGGVHTNSGVLNHAAYLMAEGGVFNGCTITGSGRVRQEAIFYEAVTNHLTTSSSFLDAYYAILSACYALYGADETCRETNKALLAVELNQTGRCNGALGTSPAATCAAAGIVTPTPSPTSPPVFGVAIGADKLTRKKSVLGGKPVYITVTRTSASLADTDTVYLQLRVNRRACSSHSQFQVGTSALNLVSSFPRVPSDTRVALSAGRSDAVTAAAAMTLKRERVWRYSNRTVSRNKICSYFRSRLRQRAD